MTKSILDYWPIPNFKPRPNQIVALEWLAANSHKKYLFLQAPVGCGKSLIGATYANYCAGELASSTSIAEGTRSAFYLTPQIILQKQYESSFPKDMMASLYGKSNYPCHQIKSTCDVGAVLKTKCSGGCPFKAAKAAAQSSDHVVLNYKLALLQFYYTQTWSPRHLIVHDECHGLEEHLTELSAPSTTQHKCEKYKAKWKTLRSLDEALDWASDIYVPAIAKYHSALYSELSAFIDGVATPTPADARRLKELNALEEHLDEFNSLLLRNRSELRSSVVLVTDEKTIKFKPLSGAQVFHDVLDGTATRHLFMSSTILDYKAYCRDLNIDAEDAAYLDLDSDFPVENRPVFYMPQCKMNASWNEPENAQGRTKMLNTIRDIMDMHKNDHGIIHTGNFKIAQWLTAELELHGTHQIWNHNPETGDDRNQIIDAFQKASKPSLLISPSITEGLDLKDDLARFAIFAKIPFGFLGDQWIKQRMVMSQEWYQRRTIVDVIQGCGRVVRSREDWGNTYILDQSWGYLYKNASKIIPQWWKDGYLVKG